MASYFEFDKKKYFNHRMARNSPNRVFAYVKFLVTRLPSSLKEINRKTNPDILGIEQKN